MAAELKALDGIVRQIERLEQAAAEIRGCRDIDRVKNVANWGEMMKLAARRVGASIEVQNVAAEASIRARHWEGTLLAEMPNAKAGPKPKANGKSPDTVSGDLPSLKDLGISEQESSRAQALAEFPEQELDAHLRMAKARGVELTTGKFVRMGRSLKREKESRTPAARKRRHEGDMKAYNSLPPTPGPVVPRPAREPESTRFDDDAAFYRKAEPVLKQLGELVLQAESAKTGGRFASLVIGVVEVRPPEEWKICNLCTGRGRRKDSEGQDRKCSKCQGYGYWLTPRMTTSS
jgi:hypothetical protein